MRRLAPFPPAARKYLASQAAAGSWQHVAGMSPIRIRGQRSDRRIEFRDGQGNR